MLRTALFLIFAALFAGSSYAQSADVSYKPGLRYWDQAWYMGTRGETGGKNGECYGLGIRPTKSYKVTSHTKAVFYSEYGCKGTVVGESDKDNAMSYFQYEPKSVRLMDWYDSTGTKPSGDNKMGSWSGQPSGDNKMGSWGGQPSGDKKMGSWGGQPSGDNKMGSWGGQPSGDNKMGSHKNEPSGGQRGY